MHQLTAEDTEIRDRARAFTDGLIPYEEYAELHGGELPEDVAGVQHARAKELRLLATNMPAELGGGGYTMLQQVLVQEQVGRVTNALAWMVSTPPQWWPGVATPYQLERWLIPSIAGDASECYAITEEGAGSDVDAITSTARRDGDDYVLDGVKWHVTSYNEATYAFFQGKLVDGPHAGEHAMFVVDLPSDGVRVVRVPEYSHTIAHHHPVVAFEGVRVPESHLVGAEGGGMNFAYEWFRFERFMVAARCVGAAERLLEEATAFARERVVYGSPIIEYQLVQAMLADSLTELFAARSLLYEAARGVDEGRDVKVQHAQASMAKLYASEMAGRVADRAVQIFGGRGYMRENVAERFYRELRVERIWEGTSEVQRLIIAAQLAKRPPSSLA
ncbi:MAG TPA: acyl-CoA dehydrogenase family protein [Acidimicrobiales bacterium]|nr:acyl-CoA dehydrogenase family protein [Acidimicrobiales bacterium]